MRTCLTCKFIKPFILQVAFSYQMLPKVDVVLDGEIDVMDVLAINKTGAGRKTENMATSPFIQHAQTMGTETTFEYAEEDGASHNKSINHPQGT